MKIDLLELLHVLPEKVPVLSTTCMVPNLAVLLSINREPLLMKVANLSSIILNTQDLVYNCCDLCMSRCKCGSCGDFVTDFPMSLGDLHGKS